MQIPVFTAILVFASSALGLSNSQTLVQLDLSEEPVGSSLISRPDRGMPLRFPTRVVCNEGNSLTVEDQFSDGSDTYGSPESKIILLQKQQNTASVSLSFEWPELNSSQYKKLEAQLALFLASKNQKGNLIITFRSGKEIAAYIQIGSGGQVSVSAMHGETTETVRLEGLPVKTPIEDFVVHLDFSSGLMRLSFQGSDLGDPVPFNNQLNIDSMMVSATSEQTIRTVGIKKIEIAAHE